jgi:D-serine deaminase-like pyridoxal phosphate-dependent protein
MQMDAGAAGLCCTKLGEAEAMASGGLRELLMTTPVVGAIKIRRLIDVARASNVMVVVDDEQNIEDLARAAEAAAIHLKLLVEIDVGQARCGVPPGPRAAALASAIARHASLRFCGLQGYQGRLQGVPSYEERRQLVLEAMERLTTSAKLVREAGFQCSVMTGGGTGSFPIDLELKVLNELQPGSYVTMDWRYGKVAHGGDVPYPFGQPLTVLASVVSRRSADRVILDAGWKSLTNDGGTPTVKGHPDWTFDYAGDEHGAVSSPRSLELKPGERVELVPSHCDTTVNLYERFVVHRSGRVETEWPIEARGKSQ